MEKMTVYKDENHTISVGKEYNHSRLYCYVNNQRVVFNDKHLDEGAFGLYFFQTRYVHIIGDIGPNDNSWTVRYHLYSLNMSTLELKHFGNFAAIKFVGGWVIKTATARLKPSDDAANEVYAIKDNFYNYDGALIRKGEDEYTYDDMEKEYSTPLTDALVNARGFCYDG